MKTTLLIFFALIGCATHSQAQDTIVKKSGSLIICNVEGEYSDHIKYKKLGHPNGSVYSIWNDQVLMIKYENGNQTDISQKENKTLLPRVDSIQPLTIRQDFWGLKIMQGTRSLSAVEVKQVYINNGEALSKYSKGKSLTAIGNIIGIPCGFAFGWQLGTGMGGGEINTGVLIGSGVGFVGGLIMTISGENAIKKSVTIYNSHLQDKTVSQLSLKLNENGVGLCFSF